VEVVGRGKVEIQMEIRRFSPVENINELVQLSKAFFMEYRTCHQEFFALDTLNDEDIRSYLSSFIDQDDQAIFVALDKDCIVGYITVYVKDQSRHWKVKRVGQISGLMVQQDFRRSGIATRLLAAGKHFFADRGVEFFTVYTAIRNQSGIAFYKSQGLEDLHTNFLGQVETKV
jgi:ribosomal protein S18 acetylase RimI-like enzyme